MAAMQPGPEVTVAAVTEVAGRFLLVEERINGRLVFNQPAGHVEHGETLLAAVVREAREETAWHFEPQSLLGVYLWCKPASERTVLRFAFTGEVSNHDDSRPLDHGIVGTHWFTPLELDERRSQAIQIVRRGIARSRNRSARPISRLKGNRRRLRGCVPRRPQDHERNHQCKERIVPIHGAPQ